MSAERSTESIIDLLYGELSEEQEREVRAELAESPDLQAEFDEFDMMLGRVRGAMPLEDVSPKIHASILEAARVAAAQPADDRLIRRGAPEQQSFWKRVSSGQGSQIALVAAVLIAGLFVVRFVEKSDSPLHAPASDISAMREAAPAAPAVERAAAAIEEEGDELAEGEAAPPPAEEPAPAGGEAIADQWSVDNQPSDDGLLVGAQSNEDRAQDSLRAELQRTRNLEKDAAKPSADAPSPDPEPEPVARRAAPAPRKKSASKGDAKPRSKPAPSQASNKALALEDSLNADVFGDSRGSGVSSTATPTVQGKSGMDYAAKAEDEADDDASGSKQKEYRPSPGTISEVDTYFRRGDYGGAVRAADNFLTNKKDASSTERASAMFIKAQSLAKQNKTTQAQQILEQLQKNYPQYRSAEVNQQLSELQRRNAPQEQKKRKAEPKMDKAAEQPAEYDSLLK